jgi:hypothetical protein
MTITPVSIDELRSILIEKVRAIPKENWAHEARYRYLQQLLGRRAIGEAKGSVTAEVISLDVNVAKTNKHEYKTAERAEGVEGEISSASSDDSASSSPSSARPTPPPPLTI